MLRESMLRKFSGQAVSEYGLILALVAVVTVGSLALLGKNLQNSFTNMVPAPQVANTPSASGTAAAPSSLGTATTAGGVTLKLSDGSSLNLGAYPTNLASSVQTTGANGATRIMADSLVSLAKQLAAEGKLTTDQENALLALSNQGYVLADAQKLLEDATQAAPDGKTLAKTKVTLQGKTYTVAALVDEIGFNNHLDVTALPDPLDGQKASGQSSTFINLYNQAVASGALNDPVVAAMVKQLSGNISYLAENTECVVGEVMNGETKSSQVTTKLASNVDNSRYDSSQICQLGGGVQCNGTGK